MNVNVFQWIREGVRQSVLLGVNDALDTIGTPPDNDDLRARLQNTLVRRDPNAPAANTISGATRPKRLGRSLRDLEMGEES